LSCRSKAGAVSKVKSFSSSSSTLIFDYENEDDDEDDFISPPALSLVTSPDHL